MIDKIHTIIKEVLASQSLDARTCFTDVYPEPPGGANVVVECSSADISTEVESELVRREGERAAAVSYVVLPNGGTALPELFIACSSVADVRRQPDHGSELASQVIYGERVQPLKTAGDWHLVRLLDGYIGWIRGWHLTGASRESVERFDRDSGHRVRDNIVQIYQSPDEESLPVSDAVVGTRVVTARCARRGWRGVRLGDGREGFTRSRGLEPVPSRSRVSRERLATTGMRFLGIPYLWGGNTPKGFDCSGLVQRIFQLQGVQIPRDSDLQAGVGAPRAVGAWGGLKTGVLLFFGKRGDRIGHVAMYLSDGLFLHAYGQVRVGSLDPAHPLFEAKLAPDWQSSRDPLN